MHRDLKPANVLVTPEGRVVILDFGLVMEVGGPKSFTEAQGGIIGTVAYMAPEQAAAGSLGPAVDWYAFGVMLFEALTGRLPFEGPPLEVLLDKQRRPAPPPRTIDATVPAALDALCVQLLRTDPSERPDAAAILRSFGASPPSLAPEALPGLLGRDDELAQLHRALARSRTAGPQVVRVLGPAGVGKTALLRAFALQVEAQGAVVLAGRCHERESVPFKAVDPLVDSLTRTLGELPPERVDALRPRDASLLTRMFPALSRLPAFRDAPSRPVEDPLEHRRRAVLALRELFERLGERGPLVVLVDDAQWGDADSVALMEALLRPPEPPAALVVTSIRDDGPALPRGTVPVEVLQLGPLPEAVAEHLALAVGTPPERARALAVESGGNPLLLLQLRDSAGEGVATVDALWRRKLARLAPPAAAVLRMVCVAGVPLDAGAALDAAEVGAQLSDVVPQLAGAHLLRVLPDERRLEPWHEALRGVVTGALDAEAVRHAHGRLAEVLATRADAEPEAVAVHWAAAGRADRAAEAVLAAAARARGQLAFARAAALYQRGLELLPRDDARRAALVGAWGHCLAGAGQGRAAADAFRRAAREPGADAALAAEYGRLAAEQLLVSGHVGEGVTAMGAVLAPLGLSLPKTPARAVAALLLRRLRLALRGLSFVERRADEVAPERLARVDACWSVSVGLGMVDTIRGAAFQTQQLLLALDAGEPWRVGRALAAEAAFVATGGVGSERRARALVASARALCERVGDARLEGLLAFCEGLTRFLVGDFRQARARVDEAEARLRDAGLSVAWEASSARLFSVWSLFYLGELAELARRVPALVRDAEGRGDRYAITSLTVGLANVALLAQGKPAEARAAMTQAMAAWPSQGFHFQHYWAALSEGLVGLYEGQPAPALEALLAAWPAMGRAQLLRIQNVRVEAWSLRGRLGVASGQADEARRAAKALRRERVGWATAQATLLEALLAPARQAEALSRAIAELDQHGLQLFAAAARLRLGALAADASGQRSATAAREWFDAQGVRDAEAFSRLLAPSA
jgi:hypothetical protein